MIALARGPNEKAEEAHKLYKGGMKLVEIASQLNVPAGTVRRWKSTYGWDDEHKSERSDKKANVRKEKKNDTNKAVADEVKEVIQNTDLTDKQQLFCLFYVKYRNKVKAYQKAYECSYQVACSNASTLWKKREIQEEINRLLDEYRSNVDVDIKDLFQWHLDIARADMSDFVKWGQEEVPVMGAFGPVKDDDGKVIKKTVNTVRFLESNEVDGTIISEVKQGRDGASIKLPDKQKSIDWLSEHIGLADEKQRAEIAVLKAKADAGKDDKEDKLDKLFEQIEGALNDTE